MAFKTFTSGAVLTAAEINTYLMQQAVIVCTAATRPSAPVEGMTIFETDTNLLQVYDGAAWKQISALGAWTAYTPTDTNITVGSGTRLAAYRLVDPKTCHFRWSFVPGAGSAVGTAAAAGLPFTAVTTSAGQFQNVPAYYLDSTTQNWMGVGRIASAGTVADLLHTETAGSGAVTATAPFTFGTGDTLAVSGTYEIA